MALKIRLRQQGKKNHCVYRLVLADVNTPRDGKYIEKLGWYDPYKDENNDAVINGERILHWLDLGAELTEKARALVTRKAPEVMSQITAKALSKKGKICAKRKALRREKTSS